ncbi:MAG: protein translocase subunit SecF [Candidatus Bipolaricaulota bacterium]|nr:protein translocase subunit SecF [Candidatus Bipolaricaulota bacterium]
MHHFDFLGKAKFFVPISIALVLISWLLIIPGVRGLNPGIDFTGGTEFTVDFNSPVNTADVRSVLAAIPSSTDLSKSVIQDVSGNNRKVITTQLDVEQNQDTIDRIESTMRNSFSVTEISRKSIGQQVSKELAEKGWQAILLALIVILIYVSWRFRLRYAVGAVVAVIHDVSIALGIFALFHIDINLPTIAAFLTIIGYSLNDTIVIFDRIRENVKLYRKSSAFDTINKSANQSLSRTLNTSLTTFVPVIILFVFGGSVLRGFSVALLIGVVVGTYSSMYIANPILYAWTLKTAKAKKH